MYVTLKHKYSYKNEVWKFLFIYDPLMGLEPNLNSITIELRFQEKEKKTQT